VRLSMESQVEGLTHALSQSSQEKVHLGERLGSFELERNSDQQEVRRLQRALDLEAHMRERRKIASRALLVGSFNTWMVRRLEGILSRQKEDADLQSGIASDLGLRLSCAEAAVSLAAGRGSMRMMLALSFRGWVETWLRQCAQACEEEAEACKAQSDIQLGELREQVLVLIDGARCARSPCQSPSLRSLGSRQRRGRLSLGSVATSSAVSVRSEVDSPLPLKDWRRLGSVSRPGSVCQEEQSPCRDLAYHSARG